MRNALQLLRVAVLVSLAVVGVRPAIVSAAPLPEPTVDYSAERNTQVGKKISKSKIFHAQGKDRNEIQLADGHALITIVRKDLGVVWTLLPEQKIYTEVKLPPTGDPSTRPAPESTQTTLGKETIDGMATTKIKNTTTVAGATMETILWITPEGIRVKSESKAGKSWLKNVKIGVQDPALFELPSGYSKQRTTEAAPKPQDKPAP